MPETKIQKSPTILERWAICRAAVVGELGGSDMVGQIIVGVKGDCNRFLRGNFAVSRGWWTEFGVGSAWGDGSYGMNADF
jgi:hypothetical protein